MIITKLSSVAARTSSLRLGIHSRGMPGFDFGLQHFAEDFFARLAIHDGMRGRIEVRRRALLEREDKRDFG